MLKRVFRAFEYPEFRRIWFGACTSSVGTWMQKLAQSWLVLELSGSPFLLGLDAFLGEIPILLFSLVGGVVADRVDRRHLLVASQVVQMSCAFVLSLLFATGAAQVWHILALSFVVGTAQAFGGPAYQALVPTLVPKELLSNAIALNSIQFNLARIVGPVLGGLALHKLGAAWCFSLNGISYLAVIWSLLSLATRPVANAGGLSVIESMKEGFEFIRTRPAMTPLIMLACAMTTLGVPLVTFLPVVAKNVFHGQDDTFTRLLVVSGAGAVAGALLVAGWANMKHRGLAALLLLLALGGLMAGFAASQIFWLSCVLLFLGGAALIAAFAMIASLVQALTPDEMRGRVMSVYNVAFRGGMPIGNIVSGSAMERASAPVVLAVNGALLMVLSAYFLFAQRRVRTLE